MENNIPLNEINQEFINKSQNQSEIPCTLDNQNNYSPAEKNDAENVSIPTQNTTPPTPIIVAVATNDTFDKNAICVEQSNPQDIAFIGPLPAPAVEESSTINNKHLLEGDIFAAAVVPDERQQVDKVAASASEGIMGEDDDDDDEDDANYETDESDDNSSDDSDFSDLSGLSEVSGRDWKPIAATKPINWVQKQIHSGANPRDLLCQILPNGAAASQIAPGLNDMTLWRILASMLSEPPRRRKLRSVNTFDDVIELVKASKNIIVLTGAGVSVSCGIPDFRSSDGIYCRLAKDFPDLPDPQAMFDINYFSRDPRPFYKFAREIYPGQFTPSPCHRFIKLLEKKQKLLRNYTQNIDTLERVAGINNVIECHGSFSTASCTKCKFKTTADAIREDIFAQRIPVCPQCQPNVMHSSDASDSVAEGDLKTIVENGIMKPDIVFFGEGLPEEFHTVMASDKDKCDLLIVMGSSLKVRPVALIPSSIPANVPQILINREQLRHLEFDVELLGDSDVIINQLCHKLSEDWTEICFDNTILSESKHLAPHPPTTTEDEAVVISSLDTDTQSVKSSTSTDTALRSTGYSDSGFESSTSSMMQPMMGRPDEIPSCSIPPRANFCDIPLFKEQEDVAAITKIKHGMLDLDNREEEGYEPGIEDEESESFSFDGRLQKKPVNYNYRHLSIDSSKDSGICDSSNSVSCGISGMGSANLPASEVGRGMVVGCGVGSKDQNNIVECSPTTGTSNRRNSNWTRNKRSKRQTAAERLIDGTFYCHESTCSYIFPGAQVNLSSDSEDSDEGEEEFDEDEGQLSPLITSAEELPPPETPVKQQQPQQQQLTATNRSSVSPSPSSSVSSPSSSSVKREATVDTSILATASSTTLENGPPIKKRRNILAGNENSAEFVELPATEESVVAQQN